MTATSDILVKLALSILIGGLLGAEREYRSKSAGFRTLTLICVGATLFTICSQIIGGAGNPDRIASNIVTGIGFLGAGVIFRSESGVNGITTAATIWAVAAVGMGIGAGHYFASAFGSLVIIVVLAILPKVEDMIERINKSITYNITVEFSPEQKSRLEAKFRKHQLRTRLVKEVKENNELLISFDVTGRISNHESFASELQMDPGVRKIEHY